jgi:hypothetical protein
MLYSRSNTEVSSAKQRSTGDLSRTAMQTRDLGPHELVGESKPRIVEQHHIAGPRGEDEIEAIDDHGRRWYHLRPDPRGRADVMGFNYTWWTVLWIVVIVLLFFPWW